TVRPNVRIFRLKFKDLTPCFFLRLTAFMLKIEINEISDVPMLLNRM
ncbi:MAG: hypothetical protein RIQ94_943, partial [Pseudomonadota bacterium]